MGIEVFAQLGLRNHAAAVMKKIVEKAKLKRRFYGGVGEQSDSEEEALPVAFRRIYPRFGNGVQVAGTNSNRIVRQAPTKERNTTSL